MTENASMELGTEGVKLMVEFRMRVWKASQ
jgi:hypothetical protein